MSQPRFIIWAPPWDEASGGVIVLHTLCHRLRQLGIAAALWPSNKPSLRRGGLWRTLRYGLAYLLRGRNRYDRGPFDNPVASSRDLADAVVVYPEIVSGNPLGAAYVARWLLHRPGYHTGVFEHAPGDLIFFYQHAFNDRALSLPPENWLLVTFINPVYRQTNLVLREGAAFIVRKGAHRTLDRHPAGAIQVDGMSHEETAAVFNRVLTFYSYDPYTLFTFYAALCGCTAVVLPEDGVTVEQWFPKGRPFGVAFGLDDLAWAESTRPDLLEKVRRDLLEEDKMIVRFAETCAAHFPDRD